MVKKKIVELSFIDIVLGADAETIKKALEARVQIDELLVVREEAYRKIAEIENKVDQIVGEEGEFIFPPPPLPVAGLSKLEPVSRPKSEPKPKPKPQPPTDGKADEPDSESTDDQEADKLIDSALTTTKKEKPDTSSGKSGSSTKKKDG